MPLTSLLGLDDTPAELADRSGLIPAHHLRRLIADTLHPDRQPDRPPGSDPSRDPDRPPAPDRGLEPRTPEPESTSRYDQVLFTRLLTDSGGRLLDTTELGRHPSRRLAEAIALRAGTCRYPTCAVPAGRCDLDHHQPWPHGPTAPANLDPLCRRHHRAKTFAWLATTRDHDEVTWTMPDAHSYRCTDDPLPTGP